MELTFLGTSAGVPTKQRNVTGLAIRASFSKNWVLVDCGEGTQHQLLRTPLSLNRLSTICITHVHGDHCYGLPGLLASMGIANRLQPIKLIAPEPIKHMLDTVIEASDLHLNFAIEFIPVETLNFSNKDKGLDLSDFSLTSVELSHRVPSFAYRFSEKPSKRKLNVNALDQLGVPKGPLWGRLKAGQSIQLENGTTVNPDAVLQALTKPLQAIIGGDNDDPSLLSLAMEDVDLLVHEATYTAAIAKKVGPLPQHSCAQRVARFAQEHQLKNLILTHFSARYHALRNKPGSISEIESEARMHYDGRLFLASDLDVYTLNKQAELEKQDSKTTTRIKATQELKITKRTENN